MKFEVALLLGAVSSHAIVEKAKSMCPFQAFLEHQKLSNPVKVCPDRDQTEMYKHHVFARKAVYTVLNSWIKGYYNDKRTNPVSKECMGDWMEEDWQFIKDLIERIFHHGDIFVPHKELRAATDKAWDLIFNNIDNCGVYMMANDQYEYTMTNWKDGIYHVDMADRIYENTFKLITIAFKEFKDLTRDDECYTDEAVLGEIADIVENFAEYKQIMHGFKGEWDQNKVIDEKLTFKEMYHNYKDFKHLHNKDIAHECPMKKLWKDYMGEITPEDIMSTVFGAMPSIPHFHGLPTHNNSAVHHQKHHHNKHAQSNWMFPQMPHLEMPQFHMQRMQMPKMQVPQMSMNPFTAWGQPAHQQTPSFFGQGLQMPHLF